jgi:hypothetical protein
MLASTLGAILGFPLGAAVVDGQDQQNYAHSRLNDLGWIAYCARRCRLVALLDHRLVCARHDVGNHQSACAEFAMLARN